MSENQKYQADKDLPWPVETNTDGESAEAQLDKQLRSIKKLYYSLNLII